jgi:hypothetical protein
MEVANTRSNRALAQAVNSRITADAVMLSAKSALWRLTGVGAMCALVGAGVGAAFFGYSYLHDPRTSAEKMATAFVDALEKSTLKMTGDVKLDPQATVKLDAGAQVKVDPVSTVRLDASNTVVRLDPNAVVKFQGSDNGDIPRPTQNQLGSNTLPASKVQVVTNYTVFKNVAYSKGTVVTGWSFGSNEETAPSSEYCYYMETINDGIGVKMDLAKNGQFIQKGQSPAAFDRRNAAANCVWFGGGSTRS